MKLYLGLTLAQARTLRDRGGLTGLVADAATEVLLGDDLGWWKAEITGQPDEEDVAAYRYAVLAAVHVDAAHVGELLADPDRGRVSPRVAEMFAALGRPAPAATATDDDRDVFVLDAVEESDTGADGMTHRYVLRGGPADGAAAAYLDDRATRIELVGGVPGARP